MIFAQHVGVAFQVQQASSTFFDLSHRGRQAASLSARDASGNYHHPTGGCVLHVEVLLWLSRCFLTWTSDCAVQQRKAARPPPAGVPDIQVHKQQALLVARNEKVSREGEGPVLHAHAIRLAAYIHHEPSPQPSASQNSLGRVAIKSLGAVCCASAWTATGGQHGLLRAPFLLDIFPALGLLCCTVSEPELLNILLK